MDYNITVGKIAPTLMEFISIVIRCLKLITYSEEE